MCLVRPRSTFASMMKPWAEFTPELHQSQHVQRGWLWDEAGENFWPTAILCQTRRGTKSLLSLPSYLQSADEKHWGRYPPRFQQLCGKWPRRSRQSRCRHHTIQYAHVLCFDPNSQITRHLLSVLFAIFDSPAVSELYQLRYTCYAERLLPRTRTSGMNRWSTTYCFCCLYRLQVDIGLDVRLPSAGGLKPSRSSRQKAPEPAVSEKEA